jgi:pimeloyl-ACP methyl ester carboxylesterase
MNAVMKSEFFFGKSPDKIHVELMKNTHRGTGDPMVFIHGGAHTTLCYKSTPDKRKGWAEYFVEQGHTVYLLDWPGVGNSGYHPNFLHLTGQVLVNLFVHFIESLDTAVILVTHSMSGAYGWKIAETIPHLIKKIVAIAPAAPGNIIPITTKRFVENLAEPVVFTREQTKKSWANSEQFPRDNFEEYYNSLTHLSPSLLNERFNYQGSQLRVDPHKFKNVNILIVTGDNDPRHPKEVDRGIHDFFKNHGVLSHFMWLEDEGIKGNGHMLMLEKNNVEIAEKIHSWIVHK